VNGKPSSGQTGSEQPQSEQPQSKQPYSGQPQSEQPQSEQPHSEQPQSEQSHSEQPLSEQPQSGQSHSGQERHWLVRPSTIRRLWIGFMAVLGLTLLAQWFVPIHAYFSVDGVPTFYAFFGFFSCMAMVVFARLLGLLVKRPDTFYDGGQVPELDPSLALPLAGEGTDPSLALPLAGEETGLVPGAPFGGEETPPPAKGEAGRGSAIPDQNSET
jgi:hypothetical protein